MNTKGKNKKQVKKVATSRSSRYQQKNYVSTSKTKSKKRVRKIKYGRIFLIIILPLCLLGILFCFVEFPIKNIFISGNSILSDQEIIELAGISDYPSIFEYSSLEIEKKLESNKYIDSVKIKKKKLKEIYIEVVENKPIFYYAYSDETVFSNTKSYSGTYSTCTLLNYTPSEYFDLLADGMIALDDSVRNRISEIQYVPNDVDDERFLLTMNDGNYVYITLSKIDLLDSYIEIVKTFDGKKGILYLDSGEYFEIK